ncbi:hypothetical protein ACFQY4_06895 [Catellatospora bangladeshensis]|uniref:Uncharacterized protein n=1 Tax=Catellatospora bangladeshensis TaxID=310355 RepID=A0A8J3JUU3_9ACTN|nr:hypothetical protein [Catellatospora bangladeshensis]GIF85545.1 hypothetical protein Cba03nite_68940 [Catellatospora bangladeshensis]
MTAGVRSRRAGGISPEEARNRPLYARVLGLQYVRPSNLMCFLFFEGTVALAVLLSLAELTGWWAVAVLPASVAAMVKVNDVIAGATTRSGVESVSRPQRARRTRRAAGAPVRLREAVPGADVVATPPAREATRPGYAEPIRDEVDEAYSGPGVRGAAADGLEPVSPAAEEPWLGSAEQRARQSAAYRYE